MLTDDENIVDVHFTVQYRIKEDADGARDFVFNTRPPTESGAQVAESAMREVVGRQSMDNVLYESRQEIADSVRSLMQENLDRYDTGILVSQVAIQNRVHRLPWVAHDCGVGLLAAAVLFLVWWVSGRGPHEVSLLVCAVSGFSLLWLGTESQGYGRCLALCGKQFRCPVYRFDRRLGPVWHLGEANEVRYRAILTALEEALPARER